MTYQEAYRLVMRDGWSDPKGGEAVTYQEAYRMAQERGWLTWPLDAVARTVLAQRRWSRRFGGPR